MPRQDGLFVPRRVIFIMIFVSLFINIFFLLMGILIGKEDLKWEKRADEAASPVQEGEVLNQDSLEKDLSVFEEAEKEGLENHPVDVSYLESGFDQKDDNPRTAKKPEPVPTKDREPVPRGGDVSAAGQQAGFWIQILASTDAGKANLFKEKVKSKGYPVEVISEGKFFKVQVGPFTDREIAEQTNKIISREFDAKGWIRRKE